MVSQDRIMACTDNLLHCSQRPAHDLTELWHVLITCCAVYRILSVDRQNRITTAVGGSLNKAVDNIRLPYGQSIIIRRMITKSYIWWMDDPWAALVAMAAIIILLCIVGIIVIIFTYSRSVGGDWMRKRRHV